MGRSWGLPEEHPSLWWVPGTGLRRARCRSQDQARPQGSPGEAEPLLPGREPSSTEQHKEDAAPARPGRLGLSPWEPPMTSYPHGAARPRHRRGTGGWARTPHAREVGQMLRGPAEQPSEDAAGDGYSLPPQTRAGGSELQLLAEITSPAPLHPPCWHRRGRSTGSCFWGPAPPGGTSPAPGGAPHPYPSSQQSRGKVTVSHRRACEAEAGSRVPVSPGLLPGAAHLEQL